MKKCHHRSEHDRPIAEALSKGSGSEDPLSELIGLAIKGLLETFARDPGDWPASSRKRTIRRR